MRVLAVLLAVALFAAPVLAAVAMPVLEFEYEVVAEQPFLACPNVIKQVWEALDGSTADDPAYPYVSVRLEDSDKPILIIEVDSKTGDVKQYYFDGNRDGIAEDSGSWDKFLSKYPESVCDLAKLAK